MVVAITAIAAVAALVHRLLAASPERLVEQPEQHQQGAAVQAPEQACLLAERVVQPVRQHLVLELGLA